MITKNLKAIRREKGINQKSIAKILGISLRSYRNKENGLRPFDQIEMIKIIQIINLTLPQAAEVFFSKEVNQELFKQYDIEEKQLQI